MSGGGLTITLGEREALPVRAIPYVAGERHSADRVAEFLARWEEVDGKPRYSGLTAYLWKDGRAQAITPQEFDRIAWKVKGFEQALMEEHQRLDDGAPNPIGAVAFDEKAAEKLPASVFVWLDEFCAAFHDDWKRLDRHGSHDLNLSPALLEDKLKSMILEGFVGDAGTKVGADQTTKESQAERQARLQKSCDDKKAAGVRGWQKETAKEEKISTTRLKEILNPKAVANAPKPGTVEGLKGIKKE